MRPILSKARPWMLSRYCDAAWGYFIWYSCVSPGLLWHLAQVPGRFSLKTGDSGFLAESMSCEPWQSQQLAAPEAPMCVARAVDAGGVVLGFLVVALDATGRLGRHIVVRVLGGDVRVAIRAEYWSCGWSP